MTDSTKLMREEAETLADVLRTMSIELTVLATMTGKVPENLYDIENKAEAAILAWHDEQKKLYADAMLDRLKLSFYETRENSPMWDGRDERKFADNIKAIESERQRNGGKQAPTEGERT